MFSIDWLTILIGISIGIILFNLLQLIAALIKRHIARKRVREMEDKHQKLVKAIKEQRKRRKL